MVSPFLVQRYSPRIARLTRLRSSRRRWNRRYPWRGPRRCWCSRSAASGRCRWGCGGAARAGRKSLQKFQQRGGRNRGPYKSLCSGARELMHLPPSVALSFEGIGFRLAPRNAILPNTRSENPIGAAFSVLVTGRGDFGGANSPWYSAFQEPDGLGKHIRSPVLVLPCRDGAWPTLVEVLPPRMPRGPASGVFVASALPAGFG
jgi:hypothetical protein